MSMLLGSLAADRCRPSDRETTMRRGGTTPCFFYLDKTHAEIRVISPVVMAAQLPEGAGKVVEEEAKVHKEYSKNNSRQRRKSHVVAAVTLQLVAVWRCLTYCALHCSAAPRGCHSNGQVSVYTTHIM